MRRANRSDGDGAKIEGREVGKEKRGDMERELRMGVAMLVRNAYNQTELKMERA
jgi:hypothetical protein